jgi:hypothetical protein
MLAKPGRSSQEGACDKNTVGLSASVNVMYDDPVVRLFSRCTLLLAFLNEHLSYNAPS